MAGSTNKNRSMYALKQWHKLFNNQNKTLKTNNIHWKKFEELWLYNIKKGCFKSCIFDKFLSYNFIHSSKHNISTMQCDLLSFKIKNAYKVVFVNGYYSTSLSDKNNNSWEISIKNKKLLLPNPIRSELFLHLNESLSREIVTITLPSNKITKFPLYILHINQGTNCQNNLVILNYRHHIHIKDNSYGEVIEHFVSLDSKGYFNGTRTSMIVNRKSQLKYTKLSLENRNSYSFGHNDFIINSNSKVHINTFIFGSALHKHHNSIRLDGEKSNLYINSLVLSSNTTESSIINHLEHNEKNCFSRQLHKSIVRDHAKFIFKGLIKVSNCAHQTDSKMINRNLLLDCLSKVDTEPQLEIYANNISCSHGATVSKIDDEQVFYLCSRGITNIKAKKMLTLAFATDIINKIECINIQNYISKYIDNIL